MLDNDMLFAMMVESLVCCRIIDGSILAIRYYILLSISWNLTSQGNDRKNSNNQGIKTASYGLQTVVSSIG